MAGYESTSWCFKCKRIVGVWNNNKISTCNRCGQEIISIREACRRRMLLDGSDAQYLEHALTQVEQELETVRCELDNILKKIKGKTQFFLNLV